MLTRSAAVQRLHKALKSGAKGTVRDEQAHFYVLSNRDEWLEQGYQYQFLVTFTSKSQYLDRRYRREIRAWVAQVTDGWAYVRHLNCTSLASYVQDNRIRKRMTLEVVVRFYKDTATRSRLSRDRSARHFVEAKTRAFYNELRCLIDKELPPYAIAKSQLTTKYRKVSGRSEDINRPVEDFARWANTSLRFAALCEYYSEQVEVVVNDDYEDFIRIYPRKN